MNVFTLNLLIPLEDGERLTKAWWARRYEWASVRAGGLPSEVAAPQQVTLARVTDPDTGDRYASVTFPLAESTELGRARELSHMLTSVFAADGYTLKLNGQRLQPLPDTPAEAPKGSLGSSAYGEARVCSEACLSCVYTTENRFGCCTQGAAFSLADIGAMLLDGGEEFVAKVLAMPGELDGAKRQLHLSGGICVFHSPDRGCTLPLTRMPLQCRTYLCAPERLLPPEALADYAGYVEALEEAEDFVSEHMREGSGVTFDSPLQALKEAARKAFEAWEAGE